MIRYLNLAIASMFPAFVIAAEIVVPFPPAPTVTHYDKSPSPDRQDTTLIAGVEPSHDESSKGIGTYSHHWTVIFPESRLLGDKADRKSLVVKVWEPTMAKFPGWNPPYVEIFSNERRVWLQKLKEVGMLVEVWAASHEAHEFLYVRTSHRFRRADGIYLYELDRKTLTFKYGGIVFTKEALNEEREQFAESYKHLNNLDGEQSADGKPPEAPQLPK